MISFKSIPIAILLLSICVEIKAFSNKLSMQIPQRSKINVQKNHLIVHKMSPTFRRKNNASASLSNTPSIKAYLSHVRSKINTIQNQKVKGTIVTATLINHGVLFLSAIYQLCSRNIGNIYATAMQSTSCVILGWIAADLGSGILHWSVDNYGNGRTPMFGSTIASFRGHHSAPLRITQTGFRDNTYSLCEPFGVHTASIVSILAPGALKPLGTCD